MPENAIGFQVVPPPRYFRFGPFELDSRTGELRKHGIRIKLKQQAFQILFMLVKRPGDVVLREEIREKLWPDDTVVEFDHSINASIQKLRDALGESAGSPRYIETLPRRGYRFIGTVEAVPAEVPDAEPMLLAVPAAGPETIPQAPNRRPWLAAAIALAATLALVLWWKPWAARSTKNWTLSLGVVGTAHVSPDGTAVLYRTPRGLVLRKLDSLQETPVHTGERLVDFPAWCPDGSSIVFRTLSGMIRLPLPNGPPTVLWATSENTRGYSCAPDGAVLGAFMGKPYGGDLLLIPASGGKPARLEIPGFAEGRFFFPEFLPGGKNILFAWAGLGDQDVGLYLATLDGGKITRGPILLRKNLTAGHYSPADGGKLLYLQDDRLYAQKLNVESGQLEGDPQRVIDGVFSGISTRQSNFSVSRNGVLVWRAGRAALAQLTWFNRRGTVLGTAGPVCFETPVRLSPDEKHVLFKTLADGDGYSVVEPHENGHVGLGLRKVDIGPLWMPDSVHILYSRREAGVCRVYERAAAGGAEKELARVRLLNTLHDVSADGKVLLFRELTTLLSVRLDGQPEAAQPRPVAETRQGRFSPDGRWVVYSSETGSHRSEIYVQPFPQGGIRTQLTSTGGEGPLWRGDGKEILYRWDPTIYSLRVEVKGGTIHASLPEALFTIREPDDLVGDSMPMAVTRDGSRILFAQAVPQPDPPLTYVMTAWDAVLHR